MPRPRKTPAPAATEPADPKWAGDAFADVKRARHRFLMERNPAYARQYSANRDGRANRIIP